MSEQQDKTLRAREMRTLSEPERNASISAAENVVDARPLFARRRLIRVSEDDCA